MSENTRIIGDKAQRSALADGTALVAGVIVVKSSTANPLGAIVATGTTGFFWGVTNEAIADGEFGNVQIRDVAIVTSGAAFLRGVPLTSDGVGRAVTAVAGDSVIGISETAATAADEEVMVELAGPASSV